MASALQEWPNFSIFAMKWPICNLGNDSALPT